MFLLEALTFFTVLFFPPRAPNSAAIVDIVASVFLMLMWEML